MTDDATLSAFTESTDRSDDGERDREHDESDGDGDGDGADRTSDSSAPGTVLSTYAWGSYTCKRCEATVERVWREEGVLVCPDCKSW